MNQNTRTSSKLSRDKASYNEWMRRYRKRRDVKDKKNAIARRYRINKNEAVNLANRNAQRRRKVRILFHYSKGIPICNCCGETNIEFLTLDHIVDGNGNKHRKMAGYGTKFYCYIIRENFPEGYQVLCMNCNFAKGKFGKCPHQRDCPSISILQLATKKIIANPLPTSTTSESKQKAVI